MSDEVALALITQLVRNGTLSGDDIAAMTADLSDDDAHQVRCSLLEASAPKQSEWEAKQARDRFRVVD